MKETNMSRTTFSGPVTSGTIKYNAYKNTGTTVLKQIQTVPFNTTLTSTVTNYLPSGCQLLNIVVDVLTVFDSATSATLSVGKTAGGTEYASGVNTKAAAGRITPTFTAAQLLAMQSTTLDVSSAVTGDASCSAIVTTITSVGQPTAGSVVVTLTYAQPDDRSTTFDA
jgi:hypothetical protein